MLNVGDEVSVNIGLVEDLYAVVYYDTIKTLKSKINKFKIIEKLSKHGEYLYRINIYELTGNPRLNSIFAENDLIKNTV